MKKIWKIRKQEEAVSPVIATILMVAITVVLAAVLYVMVMGGIGPPPDIQNSGSIEDVDIRSNTSVEIVFGTFGGSISPTDLRLILEDHTGDRITLSWPTPPESESYTMSSSDPAVTGLYRDFNPIANEINPGDSVILSGLASGENYEILLVTNEGSQLSLGGDTTFTTPT